MTVFDSVEPKVKRLLARFPETRSNDKLLTLLYLREYCGVQVSDEGLRKILKPNVPTFETIRRVRQRVQELDRNSERPMFQPSRETMIARSEKTKTLLGYLQEP